MAYMINRNKLGTINCNYSSSQKIRGTPGGSPVPINLYTVTKRRKNQVQLQHRYKIGRGVVYVQGCAIAGGKKAGRSYQEVAR